MGTLVFMPACQWTLHEPSCRPSLPQVPASKGCIHGLGAAAAVTNLPLRRQHLGILEEGAGLVPSLDVVTHMACVH
jgi:hypothetical protein